MATSTDLKESAQNILHDIKENWGNHFPDESNIDSQLFKNIEDEIQKSDAKLLIILKRQLGNVLMDMKNLSNEAPKKSSLLSKSSSFWNRPSRTQRDKMKTELESVAEKAKCWKELVVGDPEIELVGREKEKKEIIDELMRSQDGASFTPIPVIIIWGISGIGKTILARHVCEDEEIKQHLGLSAWIKGTNYSTFDLDSIAKDVNHCTTSSSSRNRIVVLDDWSVEIGDQDVKALLDKLKNVKAIMITKRSSPEEKATNIAPSSVKSYRLPVLDETESLDLFNKTLGRGADLGANSRTALEQCGGVPRAIIILAKLHSSRHFESCFAYFSLFPRDYSFDAERLIHLWMAEGFLNQLLSNPSTSSDDSFFEELCRWFLKDLVVGRSIFEKAEFDKFEEVRSCGRMQSLIYEIARLMADNKNMIVDREVKSDDKYKQVQRASIDWNEDREIPAPLFSNAEKLKSLLFFKRSLLDEKMGKKDLEKLFKSFKSLCVLDLRDLEIEVVPSSIGELKDLKYLDLSENKMENLPNSITKLSKLETLKLFYCYLLNQLPNDFKNLAQLKHLDVEGCTSLTCMPDKMSEMSSLQTLSAFVASENDSTGGLEELAKLNKLRGHLQILHLERVKSAPEAKYLEKKQHLEGLTLKWDVTVDDVQNEYHLPLDLPKPNSSLRALILEYYQGPNLSSWFTTSNPLNGLVKLRLQDCHGCKYLSEDDQLPKLQILELVRLENLEYITQNYDNGAAFYTTLKELTINYCPKLRCWWQTNVNNWPLFTSISKPPVIEGCPLLKWMPPFQSHVK